MKNRIYLLRNMLLVIPMMLLAACGHKDEPDSGKSKESEMTVLLYNISSEYSMSTNYLADVDEILKAAPFIDLDRYTFLLYSVYTDASEKMPDLQKLEFSQGEAKLTKIKEFDRKHYSTDPARIKEVFDLMEQKFPAERYGLIMAAHGSSWSPKFSDHELPKYESKPQKAFGGDSYNGTIDWIDIDELANVIPDHKFEFIWFDACYMSGIEVIYQLRNKCNVFIGYPTEVWIEGMPYDEVLPLLMQRKTDYVSAAKATFNWYNDVRRAVTIGVYDMNKIEPLAEATKQVFSDFQPVNSTGILMYSRYSTGPFYEFKNVVLKTAGQNHPDMDLTEWNKALDDFTIYAAASEKNFSNREIPPEVYSGLNCHLYQQITSIQDDYYKTLDWYKRVYTIE